MLILTIYKRNKEEILAVQVALLFLIQLFNGLKKLILINLYELNN